MRGRRRLGLIAGSVLVAAGFACSELRSADDRVNGPDADAPVDGDVAPDAPAGPDGTTPKVDSGADAATEVDPCATADDADGGVDREWVRWHVAGSALPDTQFANPTTETVCDRKTGLLWQKVPGQAVNLEGGTKSTFTYDEAIAYCDTLGLGGISDWRLPTRIELLTLVDYAKASPRMAPPFPGPFADLEFWAVTKDPRPNLFLRKYVVDFDFAAAYTVTKDELHPVRCVRATAAPIVRNTGAPAGQFLVGTDTAVDTKTGLRWQRDTTGSSATWANQVTKCQNLTLDGFTGFRLPTIRELESLYDARQATSPAWDQTVFTASMVDTESYHLWSSDNDVDNALILSFAVGQTAQPFPKTNVGGARCVKD